jgi:putative phosphoesterase
MLIAVVSDSHDALPAIDKALVAIREAQPDLILHAGDIISPFAAKRFAETGIPIRAVFGNNDGEKAGLHRVIPGICEPPLLVEADGLRLVVVHSLDQLPESMGGIDVVVSGHTHKVAVTTENRITFINPGELCGYLSGRCTFGFIDTGTRQFRLESL